MASPGGVVFGGQVANTGATLAASYSTWQPASGSAPTNGDAGRVLAGAQNTSYGTGVASLLSGHAEPNAPVVSNSLDVTHVGEHNDLANTRVIGPLRFATAPNAYELPGKHQISFLKKRQVKTSMRVSTAVTQGITAMLNPSLVAAGRGPQMWDNVGSQALDMSMQPARNIYALNLFIMQEQYKLFKTNVARYRALEPSDILHGVEDLDEWTGWFNDGVPEVESLVGGGSSAQNDGYTMGRSASSMMRQYGVKSSSTDTKRLVTVRSGRTKLVDTFQGRALNAGASLWIIVTKKHDAVYKPMKHFSLSTKTSPDVSGSGGAYQTSFNVGSLEDQKKLGTSKEERAIYAAMQKGFSPYQLFFLSVPDGAEPLAAFKELTDEWGCKHFNAHFCPIGRVIFEPYRYEKKPALQDPNDPGFQPATNGGEGLLRQLIEGVITYPGKDGHRDIF